MVTQEEYLKKARIALKDVAAAKARLEWQTKLTDPDALAARVLTQELINHGDLQTLKYVAKYLGTHLPSESNAKPLPSGMLIATIGSQDKPEKVVIYIQKAKE